MTEINVKPVDPEKAAAVKAAVEKAVKGFDRESIMAGVSEVHIDLHVKNLAGRTPCNHLACNVEMFTMIMLSYVKFAMAKLVEKWPETCSNISARIDKPPSEPHPGDYLAINAILVAIGSVIEFIRNGGIEGSADDHPISDINPTDGQVH